MSAVPPIGLIVVNYGSHGLLRENMPDLPINGRSIRLVVVDNFSNSSERELVRQICQERGWRCLELDNVGFGAAVNAGVDCARGFGCDAFVLLNPDARATEHVIGALAAHVRAEPDTLVGPTIVRGGGGHWFSGGQLDLDVGRSTTRPGADSSREGGWLTGACVAVSSSMWDRLGGFDDDYFLYWEDIDLSWRCTRSGGRLVVRQDLVVEHSVGGTQQRSGKSDLYYFYNCRNRLLFASKHLSRRRRLRWIISAPYYAYQVLGRGGRRAIARRPVPPLWAAMRGTYLGAIGRVKHSYGEAAAVGEPGTASE